MTMGIKKATLSGNRVSAASSGVNRLRSGMMWCLLHMADSQSPASCVLGLNRHARAEYDRLRD